MPSKRRSEIHLENLQDSYGETELTQKQKNRLEWEHAVTDELRLLYEKQVELEQTINQLKTSDSTLPDDETSLKDKLDAALSVLTTLSNDMETCKVQINVLETENLAL